MISEREQTGFDLTSNESGASGTRRDLRAIWEGVRCEGESESEGLPVEEERRGQL